MRIASRSRWFWIAGVVAVGLLFVFGMNAGRVLLIDSPVRSDVILVLAGENELRPERGLQLLDQGYGRTLLIDIPVQSKLYGLTEIELARRYFQSRPEARSIVICPIEGLSTREEALEAAKCLDRIEGNRVLIVTSDFHTRRALSIFRHEVQQKSFSVSAAYDARQFGTQWWQHRQWAKTCLDEWLRVVWWTMVDRWR